MTTKTSPYAGDANSADWNFRKVLREYDEIIQRRRAERIERHNRAQAERDLDRMAIDPDTDQVEEAVSQYVEEMDRIIGEISHGGFYADRSSEAPTTPAAPAAPATEHQGHTGLALEAATLAGIRTVLTGAYAVTIVRGDIYIQGYAKRGAGHIAKRLDLTRTPEKDHARLRYYTGEVGHVRVELVVDCDDPDEIAAGR